MRRKGSQWTQRSGQMVGDSLIGDWTIGRCCANGCSKTKYESTKGYREPIQRQNKVLGRFIVVEKQLHAHNIGRLAIGN